MGLQLDEPLEPAERSSGAVSEDLADAVQHSGELSEGFWASRPE